MERSGDLSLPQVYFPLLWFSEEQWAVMLKPVPASTPSWQTSQSVSTVSLLYHVYSSTDFQYRSVTAPFLFIHHYLLPAIFLFPPHPFLLYSYLPSLPASLQCFLIPLSGSKPVHLPLPQLCLFFPTLIFASPLPPFQLFIICWRAERRRMLVIWCSDCIGHAWMLPNLVPNILSLWVMTLIITNGGWWIPGTSWVFHELHRGRNWASLFSYVVTIRFLPLEIVVWPNNTSLNK